MSEWEIRTLGEFRNGANFDRSQEGLGLPVLKVKDFSNELIVPYYGLDDLDAKKLKTTPELLLKENDIVIVRPNGNRELVGRSMIYYGGILP